MPGRGAAPKTAPMPMTPSLYPFAGLKRWFDHPRLPTYEDFLAELALLGLRGRPFATGRYARALGYHLGCQVRMRRVSEVAGLTEPELCILKRRLIEEGLMGTTRCFGGHDPPRFLVVVADDLDGFLYEHTVFHELGHIAAGHFPARGLSRVKPVSDPVLREEEADLRARYAMLAGSTAELSLQKDSLNRLW